MRPAPIKEPKKQSTRGNILNDNEKKVLEPHFNPCERWAPLGSNTRNMESRTCAKERGKNGETKKKKSGGESKSREAWGWEMGKGGIEEDDGLRGSRVGKGSY